MHSYMELNKHLVKQVAYLRETVRECQMEIINWKEEYFHEREEKVLLKKKFQRALAELQEVCTGKSFVKMKQILQKYKKHDDSNDYDFNSDSSRERHNNRRSTITRSTSLRRVSGILQQAIPDASPPRISNANNRDSDSINNNVDHNREVEYKSSASVSSNNCDKQVQMDNLLDHLNGLPSEEIEDLRSTTLTKIYEEGEETDYESSFGNTPGKATNCIYQQEKGVNCLRLREVNIETHEKENKQPETIGSTNQTEINKQWLFKHKYVTNRRHRNIFQPQDANLVVPSALPTPSSTSDKHLSLSDCQSPHFCSNEISCSTPLSFLKSQEYNETSTTITAVTMAGSKAPLQEIDENYVNSRPSRRCKPTNLKEPSLSVKLRNDSLIIKRTKKKEKRKENRTKKK